MASSANASVLAERADIHKSCKSIETLLNILNEYCEAAGAVVALQKKLSKALRETASLKTTGEIAGNAMLASANIFEVLCDIDAKFAKVADKEYDIVSTEVKKWFKKLAKEEKNHDERISSANAKIKQAGQVYEKKSKKKATDVSEEHARYINLISTLGPEISQDKYNHALNVAQRHTTTTYSVAASLSRLADSEWHRSFECVRRFSPTIGPLGQWRALCEGGWTGPIPSDLFDPDAANKQSSSPAAKEQTGLNPIEEEPQPQYRSPQPPPARLTPEPRHAESALISPPGYSTGPPSASVSAQDLLKEQRSPSRDNSPILTRHNPLPAPTAQSSPEVSATGISPTSLEPPRAPFVDANTGSVRSLSAFPSPPTHFPIPPPRQPQPQRQHSSLSQSLQSNPSSNLDAPHGNAPMSESPLSGNSDAEDSSFRTADQNFRDSAFAASGSGFLPPVPFEDRYREEASGGDERERKQQVQASRNAAESSGANGIKRPIPIKSYTSLPQDTYPRNREISARQDLRHGASSSVDLKYAYNRGAYEEDNREFGMMSTSSTSETPKGRTVDAGKYARPLERMETGASSGSIVAAMRHRYSNNSGSMSPPPRELPRLPLSVNDMTSRYQSADVPLSPRARAGSPPFMRQQSLPMLDTSTRAAQESYQARISPGSNQQKSISAEDDRQRRQQQRNDELEEAERRTKEQELKKHERELELRARELERDRARLQNLRTDKDKDRDIDSDNYRGNSSAQAQAQSGQFGLRPRERRTSLRHQLQRPSLQLDGEDGVDTPDRDNILGASPNPRQKYGAVHLSPPSPSGANAPLSPNMPLHSPKVYSQPPTPESPYESRSRDRYPDSGGDNLNTTSTNTSSHASNCGCESCSVSKYKAGGRTSLDQQQARQAQAADRSQNQRADSKPDKPKSWMRRLSMPVGNAFNLDSKKQSQPANGTGASSSSTTNYSLGSGVGHTPSGGSRGLFSMDGRKNSSTTALSLRPPDATSGDRAFGANEDGQLGTRPGGAALGRRSYDVSGISNRSLTNLGLAGRR